MEMSIVSGEQIGTCPSSAGEDRGRWPILPARPTCAEIRLRRIREAAYFLAEKRGFSVGMELDDWLSAESAIDQRSLTDTR